MINYWKWELNLKTIKTELILSSNKHFLKKALIAPFVVAIRVYQYILSPLFPASCRFQPTCSSYGIQALRTHGLIMGLKLTFIRISKCHPWGKSGYDPVPPKNKNQSKSEK
ncbi:MAG: membrane protein insertion efficiency factor YidD [Bacteroidota bacterium]